MKIKILSATESLMIAETAEDAIWMFERNPTLTRNSDGEIIPVGSFLACALAGGFIPEFPFERFQCLVLNGYYHLVFTVE
jgi:hypothetical protein